MHVRESLHVISSLAQVSHSKVEQSFWILIDLICSFDHDQTLIFTRSENCGHLLRSEKYDLLSCDQNCSNFIDEVASMKWILYSD